MAVPVGEARFVHFKEPGTTLQPGEWTGPIHVMVVEHRDDETSLIVRPFLDYNEATEEDGDKPEDLRKIPTRKLRAGKHYYEPLVFDVCPTAALPYTRSGNRRMRWPSNSPEGPGMRWTSPRCGSIARKSSGARPWPSTRPLRVGALPAAPAEQP